MHYISWWRHKNSEHKRTGPTLAPVYFSHRCWAQGLMLGASKVIRTGAGLRPLSHGVTRNPALLRRPRDQAIGDFNGKSAGVTVSARKLHVTGFFGNCGADMTHSCSRRPLILRAVYMANHRRESDVVSNSTNLLPKLDKWCISTGTFQNVTVFI